MRRANHPGLKVFEQAELLDTWSKSSFDVIRTFCSLWCPSWDFYIPMRYDIHDQLFARQAVPVRSSFAYWYATCSYLPENHMVYTKTCNKAQWHQGN